MAARPTVRESQAPQQYRTEPFRPRFSPAQRLADRPPSMREPESQEEIEEQIEDRVSQGQRWTEGNNPRRQQAPLTKSGQPDRRFRGQRDLPAPEEVNPDFRRARVGGVIGDMHVTIDGKPDRRFKENRGLSDQDVMRQWVQSLNEQYGDDTSKAQKSRR